MTVCCLSEKEMRAFARFESPLNLTPPAQMDRTVMSFTDTCLIDAYDLFCAVTRLLKSNVTVRQADSGWYTPLCLAADSYGLSRLFDQDSRERYPITYALLVSTAWKMITTVFEHENGDDLIRKTPILPVAGFLLKSADELWEKNPDKIRLPDPIIDDLIKIADDPAPVEKTPEDERKLLRRLIDARCAKNDINALRVRGYACYGGNALYPCDWNLSRDSLKKLYRLTDDPEVANSLGYIYCYGRCNNNVPENAKAFKYFSIAATNGVLEGMYKLGDLYLAGAGCHANPDTAAYLYLEVYQECARHINMDYGGNFADAALRVGNMHAKGIGTEISLPDAYAYYLQAAHAIRRRMRGHEWYGDASLSQVIMKALCETRAKLPEGYLRDSLDLPTVLPFTLLNRNDRRVRLTVNGNLITAKRIRKREEKTCAVMVTIPELSYCDLSDTMTAEGRDVTGSFVTDGHGEIVFDECIWNKDTGRTEFISDGEPAGWLRGHFIFKGDPAHVFNMLCVARVRFPHSTNTYDYIYEDITLSAGDRVYVPTQGGETVVTVESVYTATPDTLSMPAGRYKKVLRKCED